MLRPVALVLSLLTLAGCGLAPASMLPAARPLSLAAQDSGLVGAYLSLNVEPSDALNQEAMQLRGELGFVDMSQAIPPRDGSQMHVTIGYFQNLTPAQSEQLREHFHGQRSQVTINGWGVAANQAAYFTLAGDVDSARQFLQQAHIAFTADDPHVTFGVNPSNPRDVHNVPKPSQHALPPITLMGDVSLMQGTKTLWQ